MSEPASTIPKLLDFYERDVLPKLFQRLDRGFPELRWMRSDRGWTGVMPPHGARSGDQTIACRHPWGFVMPDGTTVGWLDYVNGGVLSNGDELVSAVRHLAEVAGVASSALDRRLTAEELRWAHREYRRRELLEAFVAHCHAALLRAPGRDILAHLRRSYGVDVRQAEDLPLGVYTAQRDVHDHLLGVGFSLEEIIASKVTRDTRLPGRIVVPWRDCWGRIQTIVGCASSDAVLEQPGQLYLNGGEIRQPLGIDLALRPGAGGRENLILVEGILDVFSFHCRGLTNVASFGTAGRLPTSDQWETLANHGVRTVTLALADNDNGRARTRAAIEQANRARRTPRIFALPPDTLSNAKSPATFVQLAGLGQFRLLLQKRLHAYHYVAEVMVRAHRTGRDWTDTGLTGVLNEAIDFDTEHYQPARVLELDRFFWPTILTATGADWDTVRALLTRRLKWTLPSWQVRDYRKFVRELSRCVRREASLDFRTLVCAAADAFRRQDGPVELPDVQPQRLAVVSAGDAGPVRHGTVPLENEWRAERFPAAATPLAKPSVPAEDSIEDRSDERCHVMPVDIHLMAYRLWEEKGRPAGADRECWFEAESRLRSFRPDEEPADHDSGDRNRRSAA